MSLVILKLVKALTILKNHQIDSVARAPLQTHLKQDHDMEGSFDHPSDIVNRKCDH